MKKKRHRNIILCDTKEQDYTRKIARNQKIYGSQLTPHQRSESGYLKFLLDHSDIVHKHLENGVAVG